MTMGKLDDLVHVRFQDGPMSIKSATEFAREIQEEELVIFPQSIWDHLTDYESREDEVEITMENFKQLIDFANGSNPPEQTEQSEQAELIDPSLQPKKDEDAEEPHNSDDVATLQAENRALKKELELIQGHQEHNEQVVAKQQNEIEDLKKATSADKKNQKRISDLEKELSIEREKRQEEQEKARQELEAQRESFNPKKVEDQIPAQPQHEDKHTVYLEEMISKLKKKLGEGETEKISLQSQLREKSKGLDSQGAKIQSLTEELGQAQEKISELTKDVKNYQTELELARSNERSLTPPSDHNDDSMISETNLSQDLQGGVFELSKEIETLKEEKEKLESQKQTLKNKNYDLEQENHSLKQEKQSMEQEKLSIKEKKSLEQKIQKAEQENQTLKQENQILQGKLDAKMQQVSELEDSKKKLRELDGEYYKLKTNADLEPGRQREALDKVNSENQEKISRLKREHEENIAALKLQQQQQQPLVAVDKQPVTTEEESWWSWFAILLWILLGILFSAIYTAVTHDGDYFRDIISGVNLVKPN